MCEKVLVLQVSIESRSIVVKIIVFFFNKIVISRVGRGEGNRPTHELMVCEVGGGGGGGGCLEGWGGAGGGEGGREECVCVCVGREGRWRGGGRFFWWWRINRL